MIISNKIKSTKLIINIVVLILTYFFSFHIFPKLGFYNTIEYRGVKVDEKIFIDHLFIGKYPDIFDFKQNNTYNQNASFIENVSTTSKNKFLVEYLKYFNNNENLISNAPCPKELVADNLRNIQIHDNKDSIDFLNENLTFNVRFSFYKIFKSSEKLDINKCFDYIFKENLNKYFFLYRNKLIKKIENQINNLNYLTFGDNQIHKNLKETKNLYFSNFLTEVEKGNVVSVVIRGNNIDGSLIETNLF